MIIIGDSEYSSDEEMVQLSSNQNHLNANPMMSQEQIMSWQNSGVGSMPDDSPVR